MDDYEIWRNHLHQLPVVSAVTLVKWIVTEDQRLREHIEEEIARRFGPKISFQKLLANADDFSDSDKGNPPKTKWRDAFEHSIIDRKKALTTVERAELIASQKWLFAGNLERIQNYIDADKIAILRKEHPECFMAYKGGEEFLRNPFNVDRRTNVEQEIRPEALQSLPRPEELQSLPIKRIVELFSYDYKHVKALRKEVVRRLEMNRRIPFADFLEKASEFLEADPGDKTHSDWRRIFEYQIRDKNLEKAEWGRLIDKHKGLLCHDPNKLRAIVPQDIREILCHDNPEYFSGYRDSQQFVEEHAQRYEKVRQEELRDDFIASALILDLEYNGTEKEIGQIGYRHLNIDHEWQKNQEESLEVFLTGIEKTEQNAILVGHNIIDWDLRRLREARGNDSYLTDRPVWDTLVVQTLLEPWLVSHAMTGADKAHDAISDVAATKRLFEKQIEVIKPDYEFLKNARTPLQVLEHIRERIKSSKDARRVRSIPKLLSTSHPDTQKNILIPEALIDEYHWLPEFRIERISKPVSTGEVTRSSDPNDPMPEIARAIIEDLKRYAEDNKIELHPRMLPRWVAAHSDANACNSPLGNENDYRIARSYEHLAASHASEDFPWNEWFEPCPQLRKISMVISGPALTDDPCPNNEPELRYLHPIPASSRGGTLTIFPVDSELWIERAPSRTLTRLKPWQVWDFTNCRRSRDAKIKPKTPTRPLFRAPHIFETLEDTKQIRASHSMASPDRNACWNDLVSTVQSILDHASKIDEDVIHIVLLEHCDEFEKADELFANLNWAPGYGRKRFQRLSSLAGETKWKCLVGRLDDARFWQRVSEHCGVKVEFILPELPLDRWAIAMRDPTKKPDDDGKNEDDRDPAESTESQDGETAKESNEPEGGDVSKHAASDGESKVLKDGHAPTSSDFRNALNHVLPCWKEAMFPDHTPWMLDPRIKDRAPRNCIQVVALPFANSEAARARVKEKFDAPQIKPRNPSDHEIVEYEKKLKHVFRHEGFRDLQRDAAIEIGKNEYDVFVGLPTGGGKSCLFQIPALIEGDSTGRLTVVISPLKALMRDQVSGFRERAYELSVDYLSGDLDPWALEEAQLRILEGKTKLLYVAPERFRNPLFRSILKLRCEANNGLAYAVLDEAHCFWLWGNDFRPDYFYAVDFLRKLREKYSEKGAPFRFLLFSATVTEAVFDKLKRALHPQDGHENLLIRSPKTVSHPIRTELVLEPIPDEKNCEGSESLLYRCNLIQKEVEKLNREHSRGLLFVAMRRQAEECAARLQSGAEDERSIEPFHAGMSTAARNRISEEYEKGKIHMIAATKAFGMGMDIPNIHMCFHLSPPCYLEDYLQEVGRSARNAKALNEAGLKSVSCRVYWDHSNLKRNRDLVADNTMTLDRLHDLHQSIIKNSYTPVSAPNGHKVAVVFPKQVSSIKTDTQLRTSLGWLERKPLERIRIDQSLPHILELKISPEFNHLKYESYGHQYRAAVLLKNLIDPPEAKNRSEVRFIGVLVEQKDGEKDSDWNRLILSVRGMMEELNLDSLEAAYAVLWKFVENGDLMIAIQKTFQISGEAIVRKQALEIGIRMRNKIGELICESGFFRIKKSELEAFFKENLLKPDNGDIPDSQTRGQLLGAILQSADRAGITVNEDSKGGEVCHSISVTSQEKSNKLPNWEKTWELSLELSELFPGNSDSLDWNEILKKIPPDRGWKKLNAAMGILRRLGMLHFEQSFYTTAYLVKIIDDSPLIVEGESAGNAESQVKIELTECNEYNRLRELAMELWLQIPDVTEREAFVSEYFRQKNAAELDGLMTRWLGNFEITRFDQLLAEGRIKKWEELTSKLKSPEKNQFDICERPFSQNILVYAGPGAGKTEVLIYRAADLIHKQGLRPEQVLIIAFNRAVVNEIRKRVRELFDTLGYGSYVAKLQVETFHSLAIKHLTNEWDNLKKNGATDPKKKGGITQEILDKFIASAKSDPEFAERVSRGLKTILVDEFQDMNDALFDLLICMKDASGASGVSGASMTVIGDDDQDVLGWNRGKNPKPATEYFKRIQGLGFEEIFLETNFRSVSKIVEDSQKCLNEWLSNREEGRLKKDWKSKTHRGDIGDGGVVIREGEFSDLWSEGIRKADEYSSKGTCALLCRGNKEAIAAYELLKSKSLPVPLRLLGGVDLRLCRLRHIAEMIDMIRKHADWGSRSLDEDWDEIKQGYSELKIPDAINAKPFSLEALKDNFLVENENGTAEQWCKWMEDLRTSHAQSILYDREGHGITVSTIHKVKGLEFDSVVVLPSCKEFPFKDRADQINEESNDDEEEDVEETIDYKRDRDQEARLYYVALTRAKDRAWLGWGDREKHWSNEKVFQDFSEAISGFRFPLIVGSPKEVWVGYAAYHDLTISPHKSIRDKVSVDCPITLGKITKTGGYGLICDRITIGRTEKRIIGNKISELTEEERMTMRLEVAVIYRQYYNSGNEDDKKMWSDVAKARGWCYAVLVKEIFGLQNTQENLT